MVMKASYKLHDSSQFEVGTLSQWRQETEEIMKKQTQWIIEEIDRQIIHSMIMMDDVYQRLVMKKW